MDRGGNFWYSPKKGLFNLEYFKINEKRVLTPERTLREVNFIEEILHLKPGAEILDLACGVGRHSIELAKRGYKVTGLDINPALLKEARRRAKKQMVKIRWICKDMREITFQEKFDVVLNLFTSFGYFTEKENQELISKVSKALKPQGYFVIEVNHREIPFITFPATRFYKSWKRFLDSFRKQF
jgi:Cyclopropane fatty acid synthase and related methyltransferases